MGSCFNFKMQKKFFKWDNYIIFLEHWVLPFFYKRKRKVFFIQDNASYHTKPEAIALFETDPPVLARSDPLVRQG